MLEKIQLRKWLVTWHRRPPKLPLGLKTLTKTMTFVIIVSSWRTSTFSSLVSTPPGRLRTCSKGSSTSPTHMSQHPILSKMSRFIMETCKTRLKCEGWWSQSRRRCRLRTKWFKRRAIPSDSTWLPKCHVRPLCQQPTSISLVFRQHTLRSTNGCSPAISIHTRSTPIQLSNSSATLRNCSQTCTKSYIDHTPRAALTTNANASFALSASVPTTRTQKSKTLWKTNSGIAITVRAFACVQDASDRISTRNSRPIWSRSGATWTF